MYMSILLNVHLENGVFSSLSSLFSYCIQKAMTFACLNCSVGLKKTRSLQLYFSQFTHLEETFKVLNGAYKIITGSKPEGGGQARADSRCGEEDSNSKKSFEEVLEGVSNECVQLENEIRKTSRPTSKMSTCSR